MERHPDRKDPRRDPNPECAMQVLGASGGFAVRLWGASWFKTLQALTVTPLDVVYPV